MAIGWDSLGDLNEYTTEMLSEALNIKNTNSSNQIRNIENFRDASIGDVIVAKKGRGKSLGIGVITSKCFLDNERTNINTLEK